MIDEAQAAYGRRLQQEIEKHERAVRRLRRERDALIEVMRDGGASQREVARMLGLTPGRVAQMDVARAAK